MRWNASNGNGHSPTSLHEVIRTSKSVAKCCRTDTPLASSSNVSRSRPTTDPHGCFVTRAADDSPEVTSPRWPRRVSQHPPRAWARGYFDGLTGPVLRAGPDVETRPHSPQGATRRGTEVACGCHDRAQPHAGCITHGRSGIPWAEKWPSIGILLACRNPDIRAEVIYGPRRQRPVLPD